MDSEILNEWNPWWAGKTDFGLVERELTGEVEKWASRKEIIAVIGVRRSGKTSLFKLIISRMLKKISPESILFIKGDDERVEKEKLVQEAISAYREVKNPAGKIFVFIDEVQEIPEWEATLKRMYDLEEGIKFFISGSNFSMLKEDMSHKLAGRVAYFEMYPFSFREYLLCRGLQPAKNSREMAHYLLNYMEFGGFPEVAKEPDAKKKTQLLKFYYDTIVYRDIIRRREVRNPAKMESVINQLLQNISNPVSFSSIAKGASLSTDSVTEYAKYLNSAFFMFTLPMFSFSVKQQEINPKKAYCVDTGIRNAAGFRFSGDYGRIAENVVFIELKRRNASNPVSEVYYWSDKEHEVDFLVKEGTQVKELIQVCWDLKKAENREKEALFAAMAALKVKSGTIITKEGSAVEKADGNTIKIIPLWKWLLEGLS